MPKNLKIIVACANGAGTSLMMKMSVEKAAKELNVPVEKIHHCALAEGKSSASQYDIAFVPLNSCRTRRTHPSHLEVRP